MNFNLIIERGKVWEITGNLNIYLDGAFKGPHFDPTTKNWSFDHHANCYRHATKSTALQTHEAIALGLDPKAYDVYVNDVDGDTVLAVYCLMTKFENHPQELIRVVDLMDCHGPAYPLVGNQTILADQFYKGVMAPLNEHHKNKTYSSCNLEELLFDCLDRLDQFIKGYRFEIEKPKPALYKISESKVFKGVKVALVESSDFVFKKVYDAGFKAAIRYHQLPDKSYKYTIGKASEFIDFDIKGLLERLNKTEDGWGGGSTIGGSPRNSDGSSSSYKPADIFDFISNCVKG